VKQSEQPQLNQVLIDNEVYFQISEVDQMRPFFMSIISPSNHWLFIGSNGGLSAGRKDPENALFPYYTDDKIIESAEITGSKTIIRIHKNGSLRIWEPFSVHFAHEYKLTRNLYKNALGNKILFEERNHDLALTFQYQWCSSDRYGFVKTNKLINDSDTEMTVSVLDGIQNIMPYGVGSGLQNQRSNLVDAYKRNELELESGIGIFALSAIIVDKAEPSEALKATVAWSVGLESAKKLLSSSQIPSFRQGKHITQETDVKAEKGAYFVSTELQLKPKEEKDWIIVADINQNATQVVALGKAITTDPQLSEKVKEDIELGSRQLLQLNAASDGLQLTTDRLRDTRHFANTLFNIMRGGIFDHNYQVEKADLLDYLRKANIEIFEKYKKHIDGFSPVLSLGELNQWASLSEDKDLKRLLMEYLPLKFSRRHGDPSRPWNQFSINTRNEEDGSKVLDYAGNWRDIFQNWEALAYSYPDFIDGMIFKFLNASTFDGYNPYRVTKHGIDWERIEADDPWSYIGYWGDHQIIYLLKFLEFSENYAPGRLGSYLSQDNFVYANVPYKIKPYEEILKNPKDTIDFDHASDEAIQAKWHHMGSDAALLQDRQGNIHHVNFLEKILASVLSKISNFIPEGGIWMNTQRPEWNDANNALVGNGISMVTLYYLRRFMTFFKGVLERSELAGPEVSEELLAFFNNIHQTLMQYRQLLEGPISDKNRKAILDGLGKAGSIYRAQIYDKSFTGRRAAISKDGLLEFCTICLEYLDHTIQANKRADNLYHAYNLMTIEKGGEISVSYLSEMLEGQVAVLSSGYLSSQEALENLDALKSSALFREDQYSYLLYPNKELPGFLQKNKIPHAEVESSRLLRQLLEKGDKRIIERDTKGDFHFNGSFKNANDLQKALEDLDGNIEPMHPDDKEKVLQVFEQVFNHKAFTGRSGTFYGYEGLGSIYWHMVSKLQLAVQECCLKAIQDRESDIIVGRLLEHYYEINEGIGVHKSPTLYGAFPTDPYSHTPANKGAQQPGMTGQVKEDIISRFGELGVFIKEGKLTFDPCMVRKSEFLKQKETFSYVDVQGNPKAITIKENSLVFTYCQVPVIYQITGNNGIKVYWDDASTIEFESMALDKITSREIFKRTGKVLHLEVYVNESMLK
jgi:hypothetical protein